MFRSTDSRPDPPTDLVEFYSVRLFAIRESAHHFMVKPWYNVNVHVEDFL